MKPVLFILSFFVIIRLLCRIKRIISAALAFCRLYTAVLTLCRSF